MSDVYNLLRKSPDILVPSDRAIPRALTSGATIYEDDPKSGAGRAFATLAQHYLALTAADGGEAAYRTDSTPAPRRRLLRRGN
jgi:hypothetical protein